MMEQRMEALIEEGSLLAGKFASALTELRTLKENHRQHVEKLSAFQARKAEIEKKISATLREISTLATNGINQQADCLMSWNNLNELEREPLGQAPQLPPPPSIQWKKQKTKSDVVPDVPKETDCDTGTVHMRSKVAEFYSVFKDKLRMGQRMASLRDKLPLDADLQRIKSSEELLVLTNGNVLDIKSMEGQVLVGSSEGGYCIHSSMKVTHAFAGPANVSCVEFFSTEKFLYGTASGDVRLRDSSTEDDHVLTTHRHELVSVKRHPVKPYIASASTDGEWTLLDAEVQKVTMRQSVNGSCNAMDLNPDGSTLAITSTMDNGTSVLLYDFRKSGKAVKECNLPDVNSLHFLQNCRDVLIGRPDGLTLWDLRNSSLKPHDLENSSLNCVATDASGTFAYCGTSTGFSFFRTNVLEGVRYNYNLSSVAEIAFTPVSSIAVGGKGREFYAARGKKVYVFQL